MTQSHPRIREWCLHLIREARTEPADLLMDLLTDHDRLERELAEARAALAGTPNVPITVLTWQPGGIAGELADVP